MKLDICLLALGAVLLIGTAILCIKAVIICDGF